MKIQSIKGEQSPFYCVIHNCALLILKFKTMIAKLIFTWYLLTGTVQPVDNVDGRTIYAMPDSNIEYAYEAELIEYIETGTFEYNEDLED